MAQGSGIEWTESTWNPMTGCKKVSPGCKHCYAERMAERLQAMGQANYRNGFELTLQPQMLELPLQWKKPQTIFVNSMSDLFHNEVPLAYIQRVFGVMRRAHWHRFQVLTKRADDLRKLDPEIDWPANIWMGVSVENAEYVGRIDCLRRNRRKGEVPLARTTARSVGQASTCARSTGRSSAGSRDLAARAMDPKWVADIRDQCQRARVPFFFKQWGGKNKKQAGRLLDGRTWDEMPRDKIRAKPANSVRLISLPLFG